ncbi:MAG: hypothetical protein RIN56_15600 [Sporomusaceae bacterium]|nr:hypothetical protein [Sporomusaceae bacterium]
MYKYADESLILVTFFGKLMLLISTFGNIMVLFALVAEKGNAGLKEFFRQNYDSKPGNIMSKVTAN